jgi:hypothetical protein
MESVYRSVAGIDVHKKMLAVVIGRQQGEQSEYQKRKFGTTRAEIQHWEAWLGAEGVSEVVMESPRSIGVRYGTGWSGISSCT